MSETTEEAKPRIIVVLGPTGTGKSWISIEIAGALGGEVISADAYQIYRGMDIGTGKVTAKERGDIKHHLIDIREPDAYFSAGIFREMADEAILAIGRRGKLPVVAGGTGLYIRILLQGLFEGPARSEKIRERLNRLENEKGIDWLYRVLCRKDPEYAEKIARADRHRIKRALEVFFASGRKMSRFIEAHGFSAQKYRAVKIGLRLSREVRIRRIERRVRRMFASGFPDEVHALLGKGYPAGLHAFKAIGYNWVVKLVQGEISEEEAITLTVRDTRRYAKRQMTWFRKEDGVAWFDADGPPSALRENILDHVRENLEA